MRLFGTDGIRDVAGQGALEPEKVLRLGWILGKRLQGKGRVLIGRDNRASSPGIFNALKFGLNRFGVRVDSAVGQILPTPGVAFALRSGRYAMGIMISASHNPPEYNGIKLFDRKGLKLSVAEERAIEKCLSDPRAMALPRSGIRDLKANTLAWREKYEAFLKRLLKAGSLKGWRVAVDSAHGATAMIFRACLERWGAIPVPLADSHDSKRINVRCGATDPAVLQRKVRSADCRLGVAFDGDGDRCVFVDEKGWVVDGDAVLYILAKDLRDRKAWVKRTVVATEISNLGLDQAIRELGGRVVRTPVGDRNVSMAMRKGGFVLGGESSGHVILAPEGTGDGMLTAATMLQVLRRVGKPLSELSRGFVPFPSVSRNVRVSRKPPFREVPVLAKAVLDGKAFLGKDGRLVVRYSGTEPLLRVLAEGPDRAPLERVVASVEEAAACLA